MKPLQLIIDMMMFSSAQYVISCPTPSRYSCRATRLQSCITEPRRTPSKTKHWTPDLTALPPLRCHCSLTPPLNGFYHLIYLASCLQMMFAVPTSGRSLESFTHQPDCGGDSCDSGGGAGGAHPPNQFVSDEGRGLGCLTSQLDCRGDSCGGAWRAHSLKQIDCRGDSCDSCEGAWRAHPPNQSVSERGLGQLDCRGDSFDSCGGALESPLTR